MLTRRESSLALLFFALAAAATVLAVQYRMKVEQQDLVIPPPIVHHTPPVLNPSTTPLDTKGSADMSDFIRVTSPVAGAMVTSPLTVTGEARGNWYFEATFPVRLEDGNGNVLGRTAARAQSDWMTDAFVPFKATLKFTKPTSPTGTLILENDNPSGLPQNHKEIRILVRFTAALTPAKP